MESVQVEGEMGGTREPALTPPGGDARPGGNPLRRWYDRVDDWVALPSGALLLAYGIPGVSLLASGDVVLGVALLMLALLTGAFAILYVLVEVVSEYVLLPLLLLALPLLLIPAFRRRFRRWASRRTSPTPPPAEP